MGVNVVNATEHIMRDISDWTAAHPAGDLLLQVDLTNAFNCVDRQHMLREVLRLTPALYPYAFAFYGQRSRMCGLPFPVWCEQGVQQGDVCGPVFFSVVALVSRRWSHTRFAFGLKRVARFSAGRILSLFLGSEPQ